MTHATHPLCRSLGADGRAKAIICDLDGTLALMKDRRPYDWEYVFEDLPNLPVIELLRRYSRDHCLLIVSGRSDECRGLTEAWLARHSVPYCEIHMRRRGDYRKDAIIKREIYSSRIASFYTVEFCLDDRDQTVAGWRELGLSCWQVAPGGF